MAGSPRPLAQTGEAIFASQLDLIERVIRRVCVSRHVSSADADDFASHARLRLIENDYAILGQFKGRSSLPTFLTVVVQRLFLDFRASAWGKWRSSAEAVRSGPVAVLLERLVVRDGYSFDEACNVMATNYQLTVDRVELERIAGRLPIRPKRRFESVDALEQVQSALPGADAGLADSERRLVAERLSGALRDAIAGLEAQDRLILVMRFEDGRTVAEIAAMLRLDQKGLYRRIERQLKHIRTLLEERGFEAGEVVAMLDSDHGTVEWARPDAEIPLSRPSLVKGVPR